MTTGSFPQNCFIQESYRLGDWKLIWSPPQGHINPIASSYLNPNHFVTVPTGFTDDERAALSPEIEALYQHWEYPPEYSLYNLETDPKEWHDLAADPQHAGQLKQMIEALQKFQRDTRDPFLDPANRQAFIDEQADYHDWRYKTTPNFKWNYVDAFREWRENSGA